MVHVYEHNRGDHEDPMAGPTWTVGITGGVLLVVIVLGVAALTYSVMNEEHDKKVIGELVNRSTDEIEALRGGQLARLHGPARREIRPENENAQESLVIPIEQAIDLVIREASAR